MRASELSLFLLFKVSIVLFLGGFIQSSAGFGFGLFSLPILLFFKFKLQEAVIIIILGSSIQKIIGIRYFKKIIDHKELSPLIISGLIGLPIGLYFMFKVSGFQQSFVKQLIGFLILLMLMLRWSNVLKSADKVKSVWTFIAGFISGILNGFANVGGPPAVLWVLAQKWDNRKMRSAVIYFSLFFAPFQIATMMVLFGYTLCSPLLYSLVLSPFVVFGTWCGLKFGDNFSKKILEKYMETLLFLIAIASIIKPFI